MLHRASKNDRSLERALVFNFVIHGIALLAMVAFLLPALPGGDGSLDAERIATIALHPWRFRIGWLPWQLCAFADVWLAYAMTRVAWIDRRGALAVVALTVAAVVPDQYAQAMWVTRGVELARTDAARYLEFERAIFPLTAGYGAAFYTLAALGWTYCFSRAGTFSRGLRMLSIPLWSGMTVASASPLLPEAIRPASSSIAAINAVSFVMLQVWLGLVTEYVLRRARPFRVHGRLAPWRHPSKSRFARALELVANSRLLGALLEPLPSFAMESDIEDVVYVNYVVRAERLALLVPEGLELQRFGPGDSYALFTFLTYRHGHFGFRFLGPFRRFMPSPIQSNWRIHVRDPVRGTIGIHFVTTALTSTTFALGARMLTEAMPMHVFAAASVTRNEAGTIRLELDPGHGSAPDAIATLEPAERPELDGAFAESFSDYVAFLEYCVPQDRALSTQPYSNRLTRQEIDLGIPVSHCEPLRGEVCSRSARSIVGDAPSLSFRVPSVRFRFLVELHEPLASRVSGDERG